jgi:hypothetical protein
MKPIYFLLLTLLVGMTSVLSGLPKAYGCHSEQLSSPPQLSLWKIEPLTNRQKKIDTEINYIAQEFIPIVIIADAPDHLHFFKYDLAAYNLKRQKQFFLLI